MYMCLLFIGFKIRNLLVGPNFGETLHSTVSSFSIIPDKSTFYCNKYTGRTLLQQLHHTRQHYLAHNARLIIPLLFFFFKFVQLKNDVISGKIDFHRHDGIRVCRSLISAPVLLTTGSTDRVDLVQRWFAGHTTGLINYRDHRSTGPRLSLVRRSYYLINYRNLESTGSSSPMVCGS
jgi:hypothetical protein